MPKPHYTTDKYASLFCQGDERGFDHFFTTLYPPLCFYGHSFVKDATAAEDIASEAFLKVWEKRQRLTDPGAIKGYLYTVVRNDCLNYLAKQKRMTAAAEAIGAGTEISEAAHLKAMIEAETIASLHRAINTLAPECRKVFSMMYIEGKTVREVASELGLAKSTVKAQKARGLVILKKRLGVINQ